MYIFFIARSMNVATTVNYFVFKKIYIEKTLHEKNNMAMGKSLTIHNLII